MGGGGGAKKNTKSYPLSTFASLLPPPSFPIDLPSLFANIRFVPYFVLVDKISCMRKFFVFGSCLMT